MVPLLHPPSPWCSLLHCRWAESLLPSLFSTSWVLGVHSLIEVSVTMASFLLCARGQIPAQGKDAILPRDFHGPVLMCPHALRWFPLVDDYWLRLTGTVHIFCEVLQACGQYGCQGGGMDPCLCWQGDGSLPGATLGLLGCEAASRRRTCPTPGMGTGSARSSLRQ